MKPSARIEKFTTSDKVGGVGMFFVVGGCCGPSLFLLLTLVVFLLASIPFALFGADAPEWLMWPSAVIGGLLTVMLLIGLIVDRIQKEKQKDVIKAAELQRAKRELDG